MTRWHVAGVVVVSLVLSVAIMCATGGLADDAEPPQLIPDRELVVIEGRGMRCVVMWASDGGMARWGSGTVSCIRWPGPDVPMRRLP